MDLASIARPYGPGAGRIFASLINIVLFGVGWMIFNFFDCSVHFVFVH